MGLLQKACETYDCHAHYAGLPREGHETLAPVSHILTSAQIEITLDQDGNFVSARAVDKAEPKIVIPVTEESGGRTSAPCAHPLCEQLGYLADYDEKKHALYVDQLADWADSPYGHPKLRPILAYVRGGTILTDLAGSDVIHLDETGRPKDEKALVRWRVIGLDAEENAACWTDQSLFRAFIGYYRAKTEQQAQALCMIGGNLARPASQHPKGIIPLCGGNAKLISSNDSSGFTYRGRFSEDWQGATVSYEASQKAHNALRWLAAEQGAQAVYGGRAFLCWNPQGKKVCGVTGPFRINTEPVTEPTEYQEDLKKVLLGYKAALPESAGVVIAAFDAATTGRLSLTYYNELLGSDFLERLYDWDASCCWPNRRGEIWSPSLLQIVNCAFGTQQGQLLKTDDRVLKQQMQRLVSCRVDRARLPADIKQALVQRASRPLAYEKAVREKILFTACAVLKKYDFDRNREEWNMELDPSKHDRSYQFGRLLAVLEKVERDTYGSDEGREPNAIRQQSVFCQRPMYAAANIEKQLERAYFPRLRPGTRAFYKNLISQIMEEIHKFPDSQWNQPLADTYLMGYYLQRGALYAPKEKHIEEDNENEHIAE
ncbi:type I-C CRISPR-associated protein Cas8c/Csd1 [Oscillibacter valericigenes]|uniref:type I-C CRISPR-associated protein Cas8c/Csd1 n=1 Tax=Oscillibacter valericigenes TaxID=351091 RepID=UPI001F41F6C0|nr:type I-C CRISPR-associated protein Cas8c/Csd1 [Oscillibacter valericigenes]MCF2616485.1 type I-C CRISPR-associated protein Cas8c/Csd1 [Oscillibacter valericigenes]